MSLVSIDGREVVRGRVQVPGWGAWWIEGECSGDEKPEGSLTVKVGDVGLSGTVVANGVVEGRARFRFIAGKGGWWKVIPKKAYLDDAGVKVSKVLADAAREAGEQIAGLPTTRRGPHYARKEGPAGDTLNLLAAGNWYSDFAGVTQFGKWPTSVYEGRAPRTRADSSARVTEIETDDVTGLVPGCTIDGSLPATDVEYELEASKLTVRVLHGAKLSRRKQLWRQLFKSLFPALEYAGAWEYRVLAQVGERVHLQPARAASGMPALQAVHIRPGLAGSKATVLPGALVLVCFVDCDPSRPQVFAHDQAGSLAWLGTLSIEFGGPVGFPVAYLGATVQAGPFAGVITLGSTLVKVRP